MENGQEETIEFAANAASDLVRRYLLVHGQVIALIAERVEIEAKLKAAGIRVPGMSRSHKAKAVTTRSRKAKNNGAEGQANGV